MKKIFFIVGSQDLYGDEILKQAERNGKEIASFLCDKLKDKVAIEALPIVRNSSEAEYCIYELPYIKLEFFCFKYAAGTA